MAGLAGNGEVIGQVHELEFRDPDYFVDHVAWTRRNTALYYMQLAKVLNPIGTLTRLASNGGSEATSAWQDVNQLKRFICAFPSDSPAKRPL